MKRTRHTCPGPGCGRAIERWKRLCDGCFRRLPADQRRAIAEAMTRQDHGRRAELVRAAVAWLKSPPPALADRILGESPG